MNIAFPQLIFGSLIAGLIGSLIHLFLGGKPLRLVFSLFFAWVGFWVGHSISDRYQFYLYQLGTLDIGTGVIFAILLGVIGYWFAGDNTRNKELDK